MCLPLEPHHFKLPFRELSSSGPLPLRKLKLDGDISRRMLSPCSDSRLLPRSCIERGRDSDEPPPPDDDDRDPKVLRCIVPGTSFHVWDSGTYETVSENSTPLLTMVMLCLCAKTNSCRVVSSHTMLPFWSNHSGRMKKCRLATSVEAKRFTSKLQTQKLLSKKKTVDPIIAMRLRTMPLRK